MSKYPRHARELVDLKEAARKFVLPGVIPNVRVLDRRRSVWTIGSCFAENIFRALEEQNVAARFNMLPEYANSPVLMADLLRCVRSGEEHPFIEESGIVQARSFIQASQASILTFGIAASMFSKEGKAIAD